MPEIDPTLQDNYSDMVAAISGRHGEYQYFKGRAFDLTQKDPDAIAMRGSIRQEFQSIIPSKFASKYSRTIVPVDLVNVLKEKEKQYYSAERQLFLKLSAELDKFIAKAGGAPKGYKKPNFYSRTASTQTRIQRWDELLGMNLDTLFNSTNTGAIDLSNNGEVALYCFLQSRELYNATKWVNPVSSRLSRKDFEIGQKANNKNVKLEYNVNPQKIGNLMTRQWNKVFNMIVNQIGNAVAQSFNSQEGLKAFKLYCANHKIQRPMSYKELHDNYKEWAENCLVYLNANVPNLGLNKVMIENNGKVFLSVEMDAGNANERMTAAGRSGNVGAANDIFAAMLSFIGSKQSGNFDLTLSGMSGQKRTFTPGSAEAAYSLAKKKTSAFTKAYNRIMKEFNDGSLKSNAVLSGIYGELAIYINPKLSAFKRIMSGAKQQTYQVGKFKKSSGQSFSDLVLNDVQITFQGEIYKAGFNIKNYVDNQSEFRLAAGQTQGLNLGSIQLRRYLSVEDIKMLKFMSANAKLIRENMVSNLIGGGLKEVAYNVMAENVLNVFRITSQEQDTINFLAAANGHYIPASCIFVAAQQKLLKDGWYPFEVANAVELDYKTQEYDANGNQKYLDASKLTIDKRMKGHNKNIVYKMNDFIVSIKDLM